MDIFYGGYQNLKSKRLFFTLLCLLGVCYFLINIKCNRSNKNSNNNPLFVEPSAQDFSQNPELLDRILSSPHGYLRFINIPFSNEVCHRFKNSLVNSPALNLHGDAHLEQYAVTDLGRGLTDYDDSSTGPGILDLLRFGVSLKLACIIRGWEEYDNNLYDQFLLGYRNALEDVEIVAPEPVIVKRIKAEFTVDRKKYFQWIESIMEPMPKQERDSVVTAMQSYVEIQLSEEPGLNSNFFDIVKMGHLYMGIGSALDLKYLIRVHGKTDDPMDDVVLEIKQIRNLSDIDCIQAGEVYDPYRIIRGQARIAYQPFHYLGYFHFRNMNFWVHSWVDNYKEVSITETFLSPDELAEVAYDIGIQLGKGHVKYVADPFSLQLRRDLIRLLVSNEDRIKQEREELTNLAVQAWEDFSHYFTNVKSNN